MVMKGLRRALPDGRLLLRAAVVLALAGLGGRCGHEEVSGTDLVWEDEFEGPAGQLPDVAILSRPADVATLAKQGRLIDLGTFLDSAQLRADLGDYLPSLGTVGSDGSWPASSGSLYGVPVATSLGGLVWYSPAAFGVLAIVVAGPPSAAAHGRVVPRTASSSSSRSRMSRTSRRTRGTGIRARSGAPCSTAS